MPFTKGHKIWLGKKHSEQSKKLMSSKQKGKIISLEQREKHSLTLKLKGIIPPSRKGVKLSKQTRLKMSMSRKGKKPKFCPMGWNKGLKGIYHHSLETKLKMSNSRKGSKCHFWKGGVTPINQQIRTSKEYKDWRLKVFKRDNFTCQECGSRGVTLNADHIKPFAYFPELRLVIENGKTLCKDCHKKTDTYGSKAKKYKLQAYETLYVKDTK